MKKLLLKEKVLLTLSIASIFCLVLAGFVVYFYVNKMLLSNKENEITISSIEQTHETDMNFENNKLFIHMLSTRTRVKEFLLNQTPAKNKELTKIFTDYTTSNKDYLAIYLLDTKGVCLISTDPRFIGQDYSFRDYFKNSIKGNSFVDVAIGKTSNQFGYYFSDPVYNDNGEIIGIMIAKVDENAINKPINRSEIVKENTVMLVDQFGVVLYSNDESRKLKSLGFLNEGEKEEIKQTNKFLDKEIIPLQYDLVQKEIRTYKSPVILSLYDKEDKDKEIISLVKIRDLPFYLVTEIRLETVSAQVLNTVISLIIIVLIVLIIISLIIYFFIIYFIKPLDKFKLFFTNISKGDFSQEIKIDTQDEFSDMALYTNKMSKDLKDLYENLDNKVKEQTNKINEKVKESENQNKAILNILEDVEGEKSKVENLANDLEKFKLAVENASDLIVITDAEGVVIFGNNAVEKITGYKPEEALGKKAGVLWKSPMPKSYYENLWDTIKVHKRVFISEIRNKRKSGDFYTAIVSISPVFNSNGDIIYFVAIERDITKEKEVDKAKTEFVSLASHQLRTPLSAINWYTEMLLAGDAGAINEEQKKYLEEVATGNKRMVNLVDDLLNVSRLDMGTFIIESKPINLKDLINSVLDESKSQIIKRGLVIEDDIDENIGEFSADEKLLRMIFQNLLSNAIKYTEIKGRVKICIEKKKKGDEFGHKKLDEDSLVFFVEDSGMGIPIYQQDKIFQKLFRADNAKESETEGTGLGLYVIKSIVDKAGGEIWFKSEENKGTTFYVSFPISGMKMKEVETQVFI